MLLQIRKGGRKVVGTVETDKTVTTDKTARGKRTEKIVEMVRGAVKRESLKKSFSVLQVEPGPKQEAGETAD